MPTAHSTIVSTPSTASDPRRTPAKDIQSEANTMVAKLISLGEVKPFCDCFTVTKELAFALLQLNPDNRKLKPQLVLKLRRKIESGLWRLNGETIIVSRDGMLNDGQNRLSAIYASDRACDSFIVFGVERDSRETVDSDQVARTSADRLTMKGVKDGSRIASVASYLNAYERTGSCDPRGLASLGGNSDRGPDAVTACGLRHLDNIVYALGVIQNAPAKLIGNQSILAACHVIFSEKASRRLADDFIGPLLTGAGITSADPVFALRSRLLQERSRPGSIDGKIFTELMFRGWNHSRSGTTTPRYLVNGNIPELQS